MTDNEVTTDPETKNVALLITYDGRNFHGWQRHPGHPTIQGAIEDALESVTGVKTIIEGSGRTDRGTHAEGQVASARVPVATDTVGLVAALAGVLPEGIGVLQTADVDELFHARKNALGKTYRYSIWNAAELPDELDGRVWHVRSNLDLETMEETLPFLEGTHDFASFTTSGGFKRMSTRRTLRVCTMTTEGPRTELTFRADGFLYKMVRNLVRTIVRVGEGRSAPESMRDIFEAKDRRAAPGTAPASGLCLEEVYYPEPLFAVDEA